MYKCLTCGNIFEEGEQAYYEEPHGEKVCGCPICGSSYDQTVACKICGAEHLPRELNGLVCDQCIDEYRKKPELCYKATLDEKATVKINALLAELFDAGDIEQILLEYINTKWQNADCSKFIDADKGWFGEKLAKEVNKK